MAIYNNDRLVIKVCKLFYEENMTQKDIADLLEISKPQICRMLNYAKKNHIVKFKIDNPFSNEFQVEGKLVAKFGLKEAFVFQYGDSDTEESVKELGAFCADHLDKYFFNHALIGVMCGRTISATAEFAHKLTREGMQFIPLIGSIGNHGNDIQTNNICGKFAVKTGNDYELLNAPVLMSSLEASQIIKREPSISQVLEKGKGCDVALLGIGKISNLSTTFLNSAYNDDDLKHLIDIGAVASVCTSYLDSDGNILETPLSNRLIGISLQELSASLKIAIAADPAKLSAVKAALLSGYIDVFMTSKTMGQLLLD